MSVSALASVRARLRRLQQSGLSFRAISAMPEFRGIPPGTLSAIARGRDPKKATTRARLGLALGVLEVASPRVCPCGNLFRPNTPNRRYCPVCRPPKQRR